MNNAKHDRGTTHDRHEREDAACPTCGAPPARTYNRPITRGMVAWMRALAAASTEGGKPWVHAQRVAARLTREGEETSIARGGDHGKLVHWGLIEPHPEHRGVWRLSDRGRAFLAGALAVQERARVRSGRMLGFEGQSVTIGDVLGTNPTQPSLFPERGRRRKRRS